MEERKYDLYSDAFRRNTSETFAAMREQDPIFRQPGLDGTTPIWFVTRYDDVLAVLMEDERFVLDASVSLIGNAVLALLSHPEELGRIRRDSSVMPGAIEELLRYDSPVERSLTRWAAADVELGGETIRRRDLVVAVLGSANRDPDRYPNADELDATRDAKHLAFGRGSHFCLARRSPGSKRRSRSRPSSTASRACSWRSHRTRSDGDRSHCFAAS